MMSQNSENIQSEFMKHYAPLHDGFTRFCSARSYGIIDTEDLVQESVLAAYSNFDKIRNPKSLMAYLMRVAINHVNSKARRKKFKAEYDEKAFNKLLDLAPSADVALDASLLYRSLRTLSPKLREPLELFEIVGYSIAEIAEMKGVSESVIKVRLHRARKHLKHELEPFAADLQQVLTSVIILF
jgi:RNA polymerase sigma-70 factor (ECF subfamily)